MPDTLHVLPFGSHQYLWGTKELGNSLRLHSQCLQTGRKRNRTQVCLPLHATPFHHPAFCNRRRNMYAQVNITSTFVHLYIKMTLICWFYKISRQLAKHLFLITEDH